ncbi:hypothetical protein EOS_32925 [Caballeronia mineralivorans PML1(12)]|uniref:Uncharacterized protein n=1 Tax=Caballeronia mineralivorans PML1(12) TaxID=908627 RepID=A0A0J1CMD9_9BURK|nr:hypothetical protein [Caballeronia mineralivorans]KLU21950.1 hypothetical protein EOS_32925 [Caballeronia mineralivorans PML1(12)]
MSTAPLEVAHGFRGATRICASVIDEDQKFGASKAQESQVVYGETALMCIVMRMTDAHKGGRDWQNGNHCSERFAADNQQSKEEIKSSPGSFS